MQARRAHCAQAAVAPVRILQARLPLCGRRTGGLLEQHGGGDDIQLHMQTQTRIGGQPGALDMAQADVRVQVEEGFTHESARRG